MHFRFRLPRRSLLFLLTASLSLTLVQTARVDARPRQPHDERSEWDAPIDFVRGLAGHARAVGDTIYFGGSGSGDGTVIRGGLWDWEVDSGEVPEFFLDGDPVGNQFTDGWTFMDGTARNGLSQMGAGHWDSLGNYDFEDDTGSYAHRATTHANDGIDDGPDPLDNPGNPDPSSWSIWIGTNMYLNPEHCGWQQTAGYGDGWSQGIQQEFQVSAPAGTPLEIAFYHRYATEAGFDSAWVEISMDGVYWDQVGTAENPNGIFNGGDKTMPLPGPAGGSDHVQLGPWAGGSGSFFVRFRLVSDLFYSDENDTGLLFFAWQLDDIEFRVGGQSQGLADFESGMDGWVPTSMEGFDFDITLDPRRPVGRIVHLGDLACPPITPCPEACGLEGNILMFADKDDCSVNDGFQGSYAISPAFAIGGPAHPDLDGWGGRIWQLDVYRDGGAGLFYNGLDLCTLYKPFDLYECPYTPVGGAPGSGELFNWSRLGNAPICRFAGLGVGAECHVDFLWDTSSSLPAGADSVTLFIGGWSECRSNPDCDLQDNGTPFFDNISFGVYDLQGLSLGSGRFPDSFPLEDGSLAHALARADGNVDAAGVGSIEIPLRHVRADSVALRAVVPDAAAFLRWRVDLGPCADAVHPFFATFPPDTWHEARMDTGRALGTGVNELGTYMTCFHEEDPLDGTYWDGMPPPFEPCDDILPDGAFRPGVQVRYFFEVRDASSGERLGTSPTTPNRVLVDTTADFERFWFEMSVLPEPDPVCDGQTYANNILLVERAPNRTHRERMAAILDGLSLEYDLYTQYGGQYNGIGRREDRPAQAPRPPIGGATAAQLEPYDAIWFFSRSLEENVLSDRLTLSVFGGHPSQDLQTLENWLAGCNEFDRLLIMDGFGWASDIDAHAIHGPAFLENLGVDVLSNDYARGLAANDLRRCARVTGTSVVAPGFDGEVMFSGCPETLAVDALTSINSGQSVVNFVESFEDGDDPVDCADDADRPGWHAIVRRADTGHACEKSVTMGFGFTYLYPLNCADQCLFDDFTFNGASADLLAQLFGWAGIATAQQIGIGEGIGAPRFVNSLSTARPNPANPSATIAYSVAQKGAVLLRIFDVSGRLVRTLVDEAVEPQVEPYEVVWDGRSNAGVTVSSGVYFYQLEAPGFSSARKLVILQ